jgi:hypothetical protein
MLHKISKTTAGIGIILMNVFTIAIFLLVIFKILPYNSISGGRLESYQAAYQTAIISSIMMAFGIPIVAIASGLIKVQHFKTFFKVWLVIAFVLIAIQIYQKAYIGILIIGFGVPLILSASGLMGIKKINLFCKIYLWGNFAFVCLNTLANLFGVTLFEKIVMTLVTVIQAVLFLRLATDKDQLEKIDVLVS